MINANQTGAFSWERRMGVHEAYHTSTVNRIIHWLCIPIELSAVIKLLSLVHYTPWSPVPGYPADLAWVLIIIVAIIYFSTEILAGLFMTVFLVGLHILANQWTFGATWMDAIAAVGMFALSFAVQTQIGHRIFEKGIDDTERNMSEFAATKNPIPLLLIFYYHMVEILFAFGYRPALRKRVEDFTEMEKKVIASKSTK